MTGGIFLSARGLRKSFGPVEVLHGVDLDLAPGTVTALLGENGAGKSTLVRIIAGDYQADSGQILLDGEVAAYTVAGARRRGIRLISQEISDAPGLTVAENVVLGDWPGRGGMVARRQWKAAARDALERTGADLDLDARQGSLRLGERQIVEVARAIRGSSRLVIFDEPTAALSDAEARQLYRVVKSLQQQGVAILYITHRLDEVFEIADRVCVLRDGTLSLIKDVADTTTNEVVEAMVGRSVERQRSARRDTTGGPTVLALHGASGAGFSDVDLELHRGEIVGLYGKIGSGVSEVAEALFGDRTLTEGEIRLDGQAVSFSTPQAAIDAGIGYLPADRARQSALLALNVAENLAAPSWSRLARARLWITRRQEADAYRRWHSRLGIRSTGDPRQRIATLSGGNQQKVLLGRWLEASSRVLILNEPTRGVDIGAREEIYAVLRDLAADGTPILVASSDYEDIIGTADNALVMVRGAVVERLDHGRITVPGLTHAAGGAAHV